MSRIVTSKIEHTNPNGGDIKIVGNTELLCSSLVYPGCVLQTLTAIAGPAPQTISSLVPVAVTGLSVTITPKFANSTMYIHANVNSNFPHVSSMAVYRNGAPSVSTTGTTNNNQPNMQITVYTGEDVTNRMHCFPMMHFEEAGTIEPITYQVYATAGWAGSARAMVINNRVSNDMASFSHMVVMEIAQ